jgi:hypothetical protein
MATYIVTIDNWSSPRFWAAVDGTGGGHALSFAELPGSFTVDVDEALGRILISDGTTTFTVGSFSFSGAADAYLPKGTTLADFSSVTGTQGSDLVFAGSGDDGVDGGPGNDILTGGAGADRLSGGAGADILLGDAAPPVITAETDFSDGVPAWITTPDGGPVGTLGKLNDGNVFLGPFTGDGKGTESVRAQVGFEKGAEHGLVTFDLVRLDSWDNDAQWGLDERVIVYLNGEPAFAIRPHSTLPSGSFPGGSWQVFPATDQVHLGGSSSWTDQILSVRIILDDPPPTLSVGWGSTKNQGLADESWGLDNFRAISLAAEPESAGDDRISGGDGADLIMGGAGNDTLDGGAGEDVFDGGAGDDRITTGWNGRDTIIVSRGGGTDTVTDFAWWTWGDGATEDRLDVSRLRGGSGRGGEVLFRDIKVGQTTDGDAVLTFPEGERLILLGVPASQFSTQAGAQATGIPCFTAGTLIRTPAGEVPVERLRPGDLVVTRDNGPQPLRWVAMRRIGPEDLATHPELRPVRIAPGALGNARPLVVSPQHGLLVARADGDEGFARAIQLARMRGGGVRIATGVRSVTYFHLAFDRHEVIFSNSLPSESFHPGERALAGLTAAARAEFARLFPDLAAYGGPARGYLRRADLPARLAALPIPRH